MKITVAALIAAGVGPTQARQFVEPLQYVCGRFHIDTPARFAGFVAQCRVESANFTVLEENLRWRDPARLRRIFPSRIKSLADAATLIAAGPKAIANRVYAGKIGNGGELTGDGWRFRGRGLKQLTGRANYQAATDALVRPYTTTPDLVALPVDACLTAGWFWHEAGCNMHADNCNWDAVTRGVNGPGMMQADLRRQYSDEALQALA